MEGIGLNLLVAGIVEVTQSSIPDIREQLFSGSDNIAAAAKEFDQTFRNEFEVQLREARAVGEDDILTEIDVDWEDLSEQYSTDLSEDLLDASQKFVELIFQSNDLSPEMHSDSFENLRLISFRAYRKGLDAFISSFDPDTAQEAILSSTITIGQETSQIKKEIEQETSQIKKEIEQETSQIKKEIEQEKSQIKNKLDELQSRLDQIADLSRQYNLYDAEEVDQLIQDNLQVKTPIKFVDRPELTDIPESERILITGTAGSGKTRVLRKLVRRWTSTVEHLLIPANTLKSPQTEYAVKHKQFDGDVLLIWDDIHRVTENRDNLVFEEYVTVLEETLSQQGYDLRILAAARSGDITDIPGKGITSAEDIAQRADGLWGPFQPLQLRTLDEPYLKIIANRMAVKREIDIKPPELSKLVEKSKHTSAPIYLETVFGTLGKRETITEDHIEQLPETAAEIWQEQYDILTESPDGKAAMEVLRACRLLYDIDIPYQAPLVLSIYQHVLGVRHPGKSVFLNAVELLRNRQWLLTLNSKQTYGQDVEYLLHDTQLEAIHRSLDSYKEEFSTFLCGLSEYDLIDSEYLGVILNERFAYWLYDKGDVTRAETHLDHIIDTNPNAIKTYHYAFFLELRVEECSEKHPRLSLKNIAYSDDEEWYKSRLDDDNYSDEIVWYEITKYYNSLRIPKDARKSIDVAIRSGYERLEVLIKTYEADEIEALPNRTVDKSFEIVVTSVLAKMQNSIGEIISDYVGETPSKLTIMGIIVNHPVVNTEQIYQYIK